MGLRSGYWAGHGMRSTADLWIMATVDRAVWQGASLAFARSFSLLSRMNTGGEKGLVSGKSRGAPLLGVRSVGCDASLISANKVDLFKRSRASLTWLKAYRVKHYGSLRSPVVSRRTARPKTSLRSRNALRDTC